MSGVWRPVRNVEALWKQKNEKLSVVLEANSPRPVPGSDFLNVWVALLPPEQKWNGMAPNLITEWSVENSTRPVQSYCKSSGKGGKRNTFKGRQGVTQSHMLYLD